VRYGKDANQVLWKAVPKEKFDESTHGFKVLSLEENLANMEKMVKLIQQYNPRARIVFTLSPVPLRATFRPASCVTANSAVDELMRRHQTS